jgi:hypothetical protein
MINLLVTLLILCLVFGVVWWIISIIPLPDPFKKIAQVLIAVIVLIMLLSLLFGGMNLPTLRL